MLVRASIVAVVQSEIVVKVLHNGIPHQQAIFRIGVVLQQQLVRIDVELIVISRRNAPVQHTTFHRLAAIEELWTTGIR